jgi:hypothetical protein
MGAGMGGPAKPKGEQDNSWGKPTRESRTYDYYLRKHVIILAHEPFDESKTIVQQLALPRTLVHAALWFEAWRSLFQQPLPPLSHSHWYATLEFWPMQLQRFLRGCVTALAQRLVVHLGDVCVHRKRILFMKKCIFERVMSGFVMRIEVRLQAAHFASALISYQRSHAIKMSLMQFAANTG